jgi:hypothetical protein
MTPSKRDVRYSRESGHCSEFVSIIDWELAGLTVQKNAFSAHSGG